MSQPPPFTEEPCPFCGVMLEVGDEPLMAMVRCPQCRHEVNVRRRVGAYLLEEVLGEGGSGRVFRAREEGADHDVALKVLEARSPEYEENLQLLRNEVICTQLVRHHRIVKVFSLEENEEAAILSMELMEGGSLHDLIVSEKRIDEKRALRIGLEILKALTAVKEMGMVHRDLKPANILFDAMGGAKLCDFGLACGTEALPIAPSHLLTTPDYVAPEILEGLPGDLRSDFYSLGGCLYHALSGKSPYQTEGLSVPELLELKAKPVQLGKECTEVTRVLIRWMMDPDPSGRFQSCAQLEAALLAALHDLENHGSKGRGLRSRRGRNLRSSFRRLFDFLFHGIKSA